MSFERGCIWAEPSCTLAGQKAAPLGGRPGGGTFRDPNPLTSPGMEAMGENEQPLCKLGVGVSRYAASTTDPGSPGLPPYTARPGYVMFASSHDPASRMARGPLAV